MNPIMNPTIENWNVRSVARDEYDPPEVQGILVSGMVFDSPKFDDGTRITTSTVVAISGNEVNTRSGSVYRLGNPNPDYMIWCVENGCHIPTPKEPIKLS